MNFRQICKNIQRKVDRIVFLLDTATGTRYFETCFLLAVIFLYFIAYPYPWILALDDYIVLGERAWFDSSHEWLSHLLFFNQTRFTTSGDFHLFRPGLFIFYFITQDVLLPLGMKVVSAWICLINILGFFCVYRFLSVLCNKLVAVPLALWILFPAPIGHMLYVWPHIQPYWLAIAFFSIGGTLAIRATRVASPETDRAYILAGVSLFAGSMFHEFVIIATLSCIIILLSYGILIKEERLVGPSNKSFSDRTRSLLLMFSIPVLSYSVIRLLVFILFDESEYRRTEAITTSLASISVFVKTILAQATTFQSLAVGGTVFGMALIVVVKKILTGGMARRLEAVIVLSAFAAIVFILVYGRVLPGGGDVMPW